MADAARRARMMALAPADKAVLGRHLHHDAVALGHGADAQRHLLLLRDAEGGGVGFDVDDFHACVSSSWLAHSPPPSYGGGYRRGRATEMMHEVSPHDLKLATISVWPSPPYPPP